MTKEEISEKHFDVPDADHEGICWVRADWDHILEAMYEYAKQQAIAFMNWTLSSQCDTYSCTDEDQWTNIYTQENITTQQLYNQFIEQQNKP